ncbi:hypothetical protein Val02_08020 [Virgisporangium aliadipatigenens]|uniref:DUF3500 domain-containing protein n=1 Tax=Virgisporangium aliadipatigenens TaxID=741659 RepID=A0A8J4DNK6_9ACTN|nr:DUF3500 domain-containing protein [Virgisporangium aliadipatigenens]GIJ43916.1 hypothetical protein Val02_08020 [Virgisporangium aliadipatigenens]
MVTRRLVGLALVAALASACGAADYREPAPAGYPSGTPAECPVSPSPTATASGEAATATLAATETFLRMLDGTRRTVVRDERTPANLAHWSHLPDQLFKRAGLRMDTLSPDERRAAHAILRAALSEEGYRQVLGIAAADGVLADSGGINLDFGADHYWIRILGVPAALGRWTIQYGGHHLGLNITVDGTGMTLAPTLWGAQPASHPSADGGLSEPLCAETHKAFALFNALDEEQRAAATLPAGVAEIVLGPGQDGRTLAPEGVPATTFTEAQRLLLYALVDEWIDALNPSQAAAKREAVRRTVASVTFAWSGSGTLGQPVYYRVQGATFLIEFAHQQGSGPNGGGASHIHAVYREPGADYGAA